MHKNSVYRNKIDFYTVENMSPNIIFYGIYIYIYIMILTSFAAISKFTLAFLPGKSHGWRSLEGCSPWGHWGSDWEISLSLSCIREGNGNPLQCFAWRIPGMGHPGGLPSMGSHRVRHDWSDSAAAAYMCISIFFIFWVTFNILVYSSLMSI